MRKVALAFLVLAGGLSLRAQETNAVRRVKRPARITAATTYYDNKEGVAIFSGGVAVDDEEYQLHADKAYVFTQGTNGVSRLVAIGHVAMTNGLRRAYGVKASYHKANGMVVLHSGPGEPATVCDDSKGEPQTVRGSKIRFWVDSEQVEVVDADITAPANGLGGGDLRNALK